MCYKQIFFSISLLLGFSLAFAVSNDSTFYYLGTPSVPIPNGAPPVQGLKQTYLIDTSTNATFVPYPTCQPGYIKQIFVAPVGFSGGMASYSYNLPLQNNAPISGNVPFPVYGIYATATTTTNGWTVQLLGMNNNNLNGLPFSASGFGGLEPTPMSGYVIATTQCCNPNASNCS